MQKKRKEKKKRGYLANESSLSH